MYHETVKTRQTQYKAFKEQMLQTTPKGEQKATIKKLKDEQTRKLAIIAQQYERSINEMMQQQNVRFRLVFIVSLCYCRRLLQVKLDSEQVKEADELRQRLSQELELLMAYQSKIKMHAEQQHARERKQLDDRVSLRRALLEQKVRTACGFYSMLPYIKSALHGVTVSRCRWRRRALALRRSGAT